MVANTHSTGSVDSLVSELHNDHGFKIAAVGVNGARENLIERLSTIGDEGVIMPENLQLLSAAVNLSKLYCKPEGITDCKI